MASLSVGIVGLPNVGKSTLFNALLKKQIANAANYPFTTIEPNVGVVEVPDGRLEKLKEVVEKSEGLSPNFKIIPAIVKFVDIAGLVKGAHKGEGLGNQFLSHIREVDAIVFVIRDFKNPDIIKTGQNPKDDLEVLKSELLLKDLETIDKRLDSLGREIKGAVQNDPKRQVLEILEKSKKLVEEGRWLAGILDFDELEKIKDLALLSAKKFIVVLNCDEADLKHEFNFSYPYLKICAKLESELSDLVEVEQKAYLRELGVEKTGLDQVILESFKLLDLIAFFTIVGAKQVQAWPIKRGKTAIEAAEIVHSDFARGFIVAEVIKWKDLTGAGNWHAAKEKGFVKTVGKDEKIEDGQVVEFKFTQ